MVHSYRNIDPWKIQFEIYFINMMLDSHFLVTEVTKLLRLVDGAALHITVWSSELDTLLMRYEVNLTPYRIKSVYKSLDQTVQIKNYQDLQIQPK